MVKELRENGIYAEKDIMERSLKAQFKYADKKKSEYVITIGEEEIKTGKVLLKNMATGETREMEFDSFSKGL